MFSPSDLCRLVTGDIPEGHFTHIFVDEAGHAVETECLVPLAGKENGYFCNYSELVLFVGLTLLSLDQRAAVCRVWSGGSGWRPQAARTHSQIPICDKIRHGWVQTYSTYTVSCLWKYSLDNWTYIVLKTKSALLVCVFLLSAGVSFLERMMNDFPLYQKNEDEYNNCFVTKLLHNYRCGSRDGYSWLLDRNELSDYPHLLICFHWFLSFSGLTLPSWRFPTISSMTESCRSAQTNIYATRTAVGNTSRRR